jgi:YcaO-like protein with predicted kinase domain
VRDLGGTIRSRTAEATLDLISPLLPNYGITRVANVTGLDRVDVPVWMVVRPLARSLTVSQGKGISHALAMVSGIMESIELFHAEQLRPPSERFPLFSHLRDQQFIDPLSLPMRSDAEISDDLSVPWILAKDIVSGSERWVPEQLFNLDFCKGFDEPRIFVSSSNGLASGNSTNEAVVHGICELLERDQTSFWLTQKSFAKSPVPRRLRLETVNDSVCAPIIAKCHSAKLEVFVWYITTNINVPVFACTVADRCGLSLYPQRASGFGCHPWPTIALARALTEAIQSRLTHIAGARDDVSWSRYVNDLPTNTIQNELALTALSDEEDLIDFQHIIRDYTNPSPDGMLTHLIQCLQINGLREVIVTQFPVEYSEIAVVHVCIPGIEYSVTKALYTPGTRLIKFLDNIRDRGLMSSDERHVGHGLPTA